MRRLLIMALSLVFASQLLAQDNDIFRGAHPVTRVDLNAVNPEWAPFYHGVASGDPLEDRVIIWTRVTPEEMNNDPIEVSYQVATDVTMENVVKSGSIATDATRIYTVKIDVSGLQSGTTYYYMFTANGQNSLIGRTKTTPTADESDHLKLAVVSCSNVPAGYFNVYQKIAQRNDLDAVIHLGDYIYEYGNGTYGDSSLQEDRSVEPNTEILTLEEYRLRYSSYRLDTMLARVHQQHPFVTVWDDHESANDAYIGGAENHDPDEGEGDWNERLSIAKEAYFEWMPIRDTENNRVYRKISYGNLLDLIMLDTRVEGRQEQILDVTSPQLQDSSRTILGVEQKAWLKEQLGNSSARWKVIGQQVIFSEFNVGWAAFGAPELGTFEQLESIFLDIWDGYPAERQEIISFLDSNAIDNTIFLTGDFHCSFAYDVAPQPVNLTFINIPGVGDAPVYQPTNYNPATGEGSVAVEFATPSVSSANFDENVGAEIAVGLEFQINRPIEAAPGVSLGNPNPHMKYVDLIKHGYFVLDIKPDSAQADWFHSPILEISNEEEFSAAFYTRDGENYLQQATAPAAPKAQQDEPAPKNPPMTSTSVNALSKPSNFAIIGVYPNPFQAENTLQYAIHESAQVNISLYDAAGKLVRVLVNERKVPGVYTSVLDGEDLSEGTYVYRINVGDQTYSTQVILK